MDNRQYHEAARRFENLRDCDADAERAWNVPDEPLVDTADDFIPRNEREEELRYAY